MRLLLTGILHLLAGIGILTAQNIVKPDEPMSPLQTKYAGKIVFLNAQYPIEQLTEDKFLTAFEFKEGSTLDARLFLKNSLTNYLHELNSSLTAEQLLKNGNFQFTFYVDGKSIYTENLNTGAGTSKGKNQWITLRIPLISPTNEDSWGRYLWSRFYYANGGEDAVFGGKHLLKIEIRPYIKTDSGIKTGTIIAEGQIHFEQPAIQLTEKQIAIQPIETGSGWSISNDGFDKRLIKELNTRILQKRFKEITSVAVIKNGKLLLEEYFNGTNRKSLHDTRSVGKSFASTMTGIAIQEGYLKNENQSLSQFYNLKDYSNYTASKDSIKIKDLLTMSSSFEGSDQDWNSPGNEENMYPTDNWVKFALDLPIDKNKKNAKQWDYFTAGVVVIGDILNQKVPQGLESYADKKLFKPLEITHYQWQYTPQKVANTAGGLGLETLGLAKYGQLYQNKGKWKGKQLLSSSWVKKTFTNYFPEDQNLSGYGYLFWREKFEIEGKSYEAYLCSGNGGNKVYIFQNLPLVIVLTSTAYNQPYAHKQASQIVTNYLLPAVLNSKTH
ncbi:serine hydrolase domain-containing protein [Flavobacterium ginsenosidimutans]|uniref:Serine hydrolase n=1 Tax=Flavobacterium ginsenosidimutans TaxID=687844 RepID=A0ABZ2Q549_9FLAO|nr:serine hydrolase [Flavobacterium ginsenosidimutans]KAF2333538.1 serine hydrolase [Flavobacterium ginsenosidimutans]